METLGTITPDIIIREQSSDDLHVEFEAASTSIVKGTPVKLNSVGRVIPAAVDEPYANIIGYSIHDVTVVNQRITVAMRGNALMKMETGSAVVPGPVGYKGYNGTSKYHIVDDSPGAGLQFGWALDAAGAAGVVIRVATQY